MSDNVLTLVPKSRPRATEHQETMIESLERWLARAKAGEFLAIGLSAACADGAAMLYFSPAKGLLRSAQLGAVEVLKDDILRSGYRD